MQAQQMAATNPKITDNLVVWLIVNDRKDDITSLASHVQPTVPTRKAIDEDAARVRDAWHDRHIVRDVATDATRTVALGLLAAGVARTATLVVATQSRPLALQCGRLLSTLETVR